MIGHVATVLFEKSNDLILQVVLPGGHAPRIAHLRDDRPCQGRPERFTEEQRRRLAVKGHALGRKALRELGCIVTPDTILRWYRELIAEKYDGSEQRKLGRPRTPGELQDLVTRMARENPGWGYTRIRDALGNPANGVPYDGREGGYQYIAGGPYDAEEELRNAFEDGTKRIDRMIGAAVDRIQNNGIEWIKRGEY